jgi:hypothetical protein
MLKHTLKFAQYIKESEEMAAPLKGYKADQIITRIEELMNVVSDQVRFGVPSDNLGRAITYRDANGAIQRVKDILHYYTSKNEKVRFYCWSISYEGTWKATTTLRDKIEAAGGFGEEVNNINLKKLIEYFTTNPEDSDNLRSISISIDSPSIRKATAAPDKGEVEDETTTVAEKPSEVTIEKPIEKPTEETNKE